MTETINQRIKATALFNRLNGAFVTVTSLPLEESQHDEAYYIAREVEYQFGPDGDQIVGDITINPDGTTTDNFKVASKTEQETIVTEAQMNAMAAEKITSRYPVANQINIVASAVLKLGEVHELLDTPQFEALNEMVEYINYCLQVNKTKKEHYRDDPTITYESDEDVATRLSRSMEGGVHEAIGPRNITGGRVFA